MDFDNRLIKNVLDDISRLIEQLSDLEKYADDLNEEEKESIKKESLEQLINNTKILEKMKSGDLKCSTEIEDARKVKSLILIIKYFFINLETQSSFSTKL